MHETSPSTSLWRGLFFIQFYIKKGGADMYGNYMDYMQQNPYQNHLNSLQQPYVNKVQITQVSGKNGADAYQMPPNSSILLLDNSQPIVWLKTTDGAGFPTCTPYQITPYQAKPEPDYNSLNERITRLEGILNGKSDATATEPNSGTAAEPDSKIQ